MDYLGLIQKFKVNRSLTDEERELRLRQKLRLEVEPSDQLAVIKLNSTYLETVDRYYADKGWLTLWMVVAVAILVWLIVGMSVVTFARNPGMPVVPLGQALAFLAFVYAIAAVPLGFALFGLKKEALGYTHYPIRLNRMTRTVHVFRQDGSVLSVPWDTVYFALGRGVRMYGFQNWDVRGHVLAEDGVTVEETFAFADTSTDQEILRRHWEFLRRYMEDGPKTAYEKVKYCMPVDGRRETFRQSWWRVMEEEWFLPLRYLGYPLIVLAICGRWLAMRLGKVPVWPADVEAVCAIEPNDLYIKDARHNPSDLRVVEPPKVVT